MKSEKGFIVPILLILVLVVVLANAGLWYYVFNIKGQVPSINLFNQTEQFTNVPGKPTNLPTSVPTPTIVVTTPDEDLIKIAFAKKYNKQVSDIELSVSKKDATHAWGTVRFAGEMGGGWFLTFKEVTGWIIVADGNGIILCKDIQPYDFPISMVPECVDQNGKVVKR